MDNSFTTTTIEEKVKELKSKMHAGIVEFTYIKKDGTERRAKGTLHTEIIEEHGGALPTGQITPPFYTTRYFDIDKGEWRSFINESLK